MVWGGITLTERTELHNGQENVTGLYNRDNVIEPIGVPYARRHGNAFIFQDDEAGARRARVLQDHLQFRRIHDSPMASEVLRPVSNRTFVIHTREK